MNLSKAFSFTASNFSTAELSGSTHFSTMQQQHATSGDGGLFYLHLDPYMMGVGGDDRYEYIDYALKYWI
jgi:hypothetical protein